MVFRCPTPSDMVNATLALLPRGRAWQTNEGLPRAGADRGFDPTSFDNAAFSVLQEPISVLRQYWNAVASVYAFVTRRVCDLRNEFWCSTLVETHDVWMVEYGLPDDCDPFPDLCTKVSALGGTRCEYYAAIAARAGWSIECETLQSIDCGDAVGNASAGCATTGGQIRGGIIIIRVNLHESPAFVGAFEILPYAGNFALGASLACEPDISPLVCIMDRIVHAHIAIIYDKF